MYRYIISIEYICIRYSKVWLSTVYNGIVGSEDKRLIVWDTEKGVPLSSLQLHLPILGLAMSTDATRIAVHPFESRHLPIICLHNTPATYVKPPVYVAPAKEIEGKFH